MTGVTTTRGRTEADFVEFVAASRPTLRRIAHLLVPDPGDAEDLLQEALVRALGAWHRVRPGEEVAYVRRIMSNLAVDRWRRRRPVVLGGVPEQHAGRDDLVTVDHRSELVQGLAALTVRERAVVVLRYYADLSERQVADELGVSVGTVKSTASRALARLRGSMATRSI